MKRLICAAVATLLVFMPVTMVHAWGVEGHEAVGALAQSLLSDATKAQVQALLGTETLASVSNWADPIKFTTRKETYNWHFVDIPLSEAGFLHDRDCFRPEDTQHPGSATDHNNCVVDRITMFKQDLADPTKTADQKLEALKFIVHFVGDIHQPFHAVGDKRGGNDNHITEFGQTNCGSGGHSSPCNLHSAWDTGMIMHAGLDVNAYVQHLKDVIATNHLTAGGTPEDWANESHAAGGPAWIDNGGVLDDAYYGTNIQVADKRLALAGLRLAALLEDVFGGTPPPPPAQAAVATRNVRLRRDPSSAHTALETIQKGATVTLQEPGKTNNYYHVKAADGKEGWVYSRYVQLQ